MNRAFARLLNPFEAAPRKSLFGGGGGGNQTMQQIQMLQQQQELRNLQGRQLATLADQQASADNESALMRKPGLGRALLTYGADRRRSTLGG